MTITLHTGRGRRTARRARSPAGPRLPRDEDERAAALLPAEVCRRLSSIPTTICPPSPRADPPRARARRHRHYQRQARHADAEGVRLAAATNMAARCKDSMGRSDRRGEFPDGDRRSAVAGGLHPIVHDPSSDPRQGFKRALGDQHQDVERDRTAPAATCSATARRSRPLPAALKEQIDPSQKRPSRGDRANDPGSWI